MKHQFENSLKPLQIGKITVKNRYAVAPMALSGLHGSRGEFNDRALRYYEERAKGGFGLLFTGALFTDIGVDPFSAVESASPLHAPSIFMRSALTMNERTQAYGAKMFAQISMGLGRNAFGQHAPSAIPSFANPGEMAPALTNEQIKKKIEFMVQAAGLMKASGFDGVEVHAMHWGYLLDQFGMSLMNKRTDEYGGSLENRLRCAKEIVEGIKQVCGADFPVSMRLGLKTYIKGFNRASLDGSEEAGRTLEEGVKISQMLESFGYDVLNVDAGVYDSFYYASAPMYMPKGYAIELAEKAKQAVKIPVLTCSRMDDPVMAEQAVADGKTDGIVLGRASLADPHYVQKIIRNQPEQIRPCIACNQGCIGLLLKGGDCSCAVNPAAGRELTFGLEKAVKPKKVAVIGGGVAGMEAARVSSLRGHQVSLYEKTGNLGGHLVPGSRHEFKEDLNRLNEWYQLQLRDLGVDIHMNTELDTDAVRSLDADAVALSVGSEPVIPKLPGIDHPKVVSSIDALLEKKEIGQKVVVVGGGLVGCEIAYDYAKSGRDVTVLEAMDAILSAGETVPLMNTLMLNDLFAKYNIRVVTGHKLESVSDQGAIAVSASGSGGKMILEADTIVIAVGYRPLPSIAGELSGSAFDVYEIGDGRQVGSVLTSIADAYTVAGRI